MATVGYDNSVRIWNVNEMNVISIIEDKTNKAIEKDGHINALSWAYTVANPSDEILMVGTSAGYVKIIDAKKNKVVSKVQLSSSQIFDSDWGIYGIAVASEDTNV